MIVLKKFARLMARRLSVLFWVFACLGNTASAETAMPTIVIILDDIGYRHSDHQALSLPREVTFAILPDAPLTQEMSELAHTQGRDVMLHMPMEAENGSEMGPDGLSADMFDHKIALNFERALSSVPYAVGVNNHMGSKLTSEYHPMEVLMSLIKAKNLFFVDSRTSVRTVAEKVAENAGIPVTRRNVFIDHIVSEESMEKELQKLLALARKQGTAVGIAHPHPETLKFLARRLPTLQKQGISLSSVSDIFDNDDTLTAQQPSGKISLSAPN